MCGVIRGNSDREAALNEMKWKIRKLQDEVRAQQLGKNIVADIRPAPRDIDIFREAMRRINAEDKQ